MNPLEILQQAYKHNPRAVGTIWIVVGLAAGGAIAIGLFGGDWLTAVGGVVGTLCLAVLGSTLLAKEGPLRSAVAWVLALAMLASVLLSISSFFFCWPADWGPHCESPGSPAPPNETLLASPLLAKMAGFAGYDESARSETNTFVTEAALADLKLSLDDIDRKWLNQINWMFARMFSRYVGKLVEVIRDEEFLGRGSGFLDKMEDRKITSGMSAHITDEMKDLEFTVDEPLLTFFLNKLKKKSGLHSPIHMRLKKAERNGGRTNAHKMDYLLKDWDSELRGLRDESIAETDAGLRNLRLLR